MREAPGLVLIDKLLKAGCQIRAYDPAAMNECKRRIGDVIYYARDMYDAVLDADVLMLITEWKEFVSAFMGCHQKDYESANCAGWTQYL